MTSSDLRIFHRSVGIEAFKIPLAVLEDVDLVDSVTPYVIHHEEDQVDLGLIAA